MLDFNLSRLAVLASGPGDAHRITSGVVVEMNCLIDLV